MEAAILFFFQAEDGIRDIGVTGVQTCASSDLLNCIRIVFGKEKVYFVSTDSYRLLYLKKNLLSQFERAISLPLEAANVIIKLLKDKDEKISLELSGDNLLLLWKDKIGRAHV